MSHDQVPTPEELDLLRREAGEARRTLDYERAITLNRRRADGWRKRGERAQEAATLVELSRDYQSNGQPLVAFVCLAEAEALVPDDATVRLALGDLYTQLRLREQAIAVYERAGALATSRLMAAYLSKGDRVRARTFLERERQRLQQAKNLRGEANLLAAWGEPATYAEAEALLVRALAATKDPVEQAQMLSLRATLLGLLKRPDEARQCFEEQLALCQRAGLVPERFMALGAYASFEYFQGAKPKVLALVQRYLSFAQQQQSPVDERGALQKRLDFASYDQDWAQVAAACSELISLCVAQGWRGTYDLPYFQDRHAEALQKLGKRSEASAACRAAIAVLEQRRRTYAGLSDAALAFRQGSRSPYERLLGLLPPQSPEAFGLVQRLKARALREQLTLGRGSQEAAPSPEETALRARCEQLNAALVQEGIANAVGGKKRFAELQSELRQAETALARFYDTLHARSPQTALCRAASEPTLAQVQAQLKPRQLLLDFVLPTLPEEKVRVLALQRQSVTLITLPTPLAELRGRVQQLREACSSPDRPWQDAARALADVLIAPLASQLRGMEQVVLCPDGALWEVPFLVLLDQPVVSYAFSAALWLQQRTLPALPPRPLSLLAVAAPNLAGFNRPIIAPERPIIAPERPIIAPERPIIAPERSVFLPPGMLSLSLPGTLQEAAALGQLFPEATVLLGKDAQESRVKADAVRCRRLHIATHAFVNDTAPALSCLVLSDPTDLSREDGFLTARELMGLDLSGLELVTLSACNTARGQLLTGEGVRGLSWALTAAGARNLVLSQWSVPDEATVVGMQAFYAALKRGLSKPAALRHASLEQRKLPGREHPYYWGAFILIGSGL
ncbi:CHAT domain-containing protein [Armatimonas rosea]|uniref:CHAT domain-containing protein n=1 Tax=Armatimonas rosea TaxID=685828 RepID=A0A7W9W3K7_ARMRO|nr:CHAT domain-containing protein [Armatimonas rosea]MBB6048514.1 CHAT domain-containing protein [Armatimonas rosea]